MGKGLLAKMNFKGLNLLPGVKRQPWCPCVEGGEMLNRPFCRAHGGSLHPWGRENETCPFPGWMVVYMGINSNYIGLSNAGLQ